MDSIPNAFVCASTTLFIFFVFTSIVPLAPRLTTSPQLCQRIPSSPTLHNLLFGVAAGSEVWDFRQSYIKAWWKPNQTRGFVWLEKLPPQGSGKNSTDTFLLPPLMISGNTSAFPYTFVGPVNVNEQKHQLRMSRIVVEMFRLGLPDVHWFVMGDDDTIFYPENLLKVLAKYDHRQLFYIGSISESHLQNVQGFSTNMAYGGAGYAISYSLAEKLESIEDGCLKRYHFLYSSDARIHACIAELGVSLTIEPGFHQLDIHGDASGILGAHPLAPLVSLHHIDRIDSIFPSMNRVESLHHLSRAYQLDPGGVLQQSICYSTRLRWSVKVSWGYAVQVMRILVAPRDLELPVRTFTGWHDDRSEVGFSFKSHALPADPCLRYEMFYMSEVESFPAPEGQSGIFTVSRYFRGFEKRRCDKQDQLSKLEWINVTKEIGTSEAPRRQCCEIAWLSDRVMDLVVSNCKSII